VIIHTARPAFIGDGYRCADVLISVVCLCLGC